MPVSSGLRAPSIALPKLNEPGPDDGGGSLLGGHGHGGNNGRGLFLNVPGGGGGGGGGGGSGLLGLGSSGSQQQSTRRASFLAPTETGSISAAKLLGQAINAGIVPGPGHMPERRLSIMVGNSERKLSINPGTLKRMGSTIPEPAQEERTSSVSSDDFFKIRTTNVRQNRVIVDICGKKFDLTEAKRNVVKTQNARLSRQFRTIYKSRQFDDMIVKASEYILWFLRTNHLEKSRAAGVQNLSTTSGSNPTTAGTQASSTGSMPPPFSTAQTPHPITPMVTPAPPQASSPSYPTTPSTPGPVAGSPQSPDIASSPRTGATQAPRSMSITQTPPNTGATGTGTGGRGRNVLFAEGESCDLDTARKERDRRFKEFGAAYCFLLLFASAHSAEPAKERSCFETIYAFTKQAVVGLLSLPAFTSLIDAELTRVFRSTLFSGSSGSKEDQLMLRKFDGGVGGGGAGGGRALSVVGGSGTSGGGGGGGGAGSGGAASGRFTSSAMRDGWMGALGGSRPDSSSTRDSGRYGSAQGSRSRPTSSRLGSAGYPGRAGGTGLSRRLGKSYSGVAGGSSGGHRLSYIRGSVMGGGSAFGNRTSFGYRKPFKSSTSHVSRTDSTTTDGMGPQGGEGGSAQNPGEQPPAQGNENQEPDDESQLVGAAARKPTRRKRLSINDVRMARSPLADAVLPPPQRFLFVQTRAGTIGNLVGV
ncbi:hypothetical protein HDU96_006515 [Phlyctochytrium bullatum]|nr:hypothetical protein HDU96_006515 [Phlyctochytrium bullatum]